MEKIKVKNLAKYKGREETLERRVPLLNCVWNDVLQFAPLNPAKVFELQVELGLIPTVPHYNFYKINIDELDTNKAAVFFKTGPGDENISVKWFRDIDFSSLQEIPLATLNYYKTLIGTNELPFNYQFLPHILYKGTLDISNTEIVTI